MKKLLFILLITRYSLLTTVLKAQNLVPNPSFEFYTQCPWTMGQLNLAFPWQNPNNRTPDFFNTCCSTSAGSSIPNNAWGSENAHTGIGYSGGCSFYKTGLGREYIQVQLNDSLQKNTTYCVEFYVSLAEVSDYAVNNLGAFLSSYPISSSTDLILCTPQIVNSSANPLINKNSWTKISGSFITSGGEQYITIGNFNDDSASDTVRVDSSGYSGGMTYYYIDDISVYDCSAPVYVAEAGNNVTICKGDSVQIGSAPRTQYIYNWQTAAGLSNDSIANPWVKPAITTTYYLHQKDFKFDETVDSITVVVKDCNDSLTIPNAFTPNGDGVNDFFKVKGNNIRTISGKIFNRWGQLLYNYSDINKPWDGKYNNKYVSDGVYFYIINVVFEDGETQEKHGYLELVR